MASPIAVPMNSRLSQLRLARNARSVHTRKPRNAATPARPTATDGMPCNGSSTHSATVARMMTSIFFSSTDMGPRSFSSGGCAFGADSASSAAAPARRGRPRSPFGPYISTMTAKLTTVTNTNHGSAAMNQLTMLKCACTSSG